MNVNQIILAAIAAAGVIALSLFFAPGFHISTPIEQNVISNIVIHGGAVGSGVLINSDTILTVAHVANDAKDGYVAFSDAPTVKYKYSVLIVDNQHDLAILKLDKQVGRYPVTLSCDTPAIGTSIYAIGSPYAYNWMIRWGHVASKDWIRDSTWKYPEQATELLSQTYTADMNGLPGNSGGGVYEERTGALVGILGDVAYTLEHDISDRVLFKQYIDLSMPHKPEQLCKFLEDNKIDFVKQL